LSTPARIFIRHILHHSVGRCVGWGLAQRIANLLRKASGDELKLTPWQLGQVREAIEQLEEARFAAGERTMSEAGRRDLYEPAGYVAKERFDRLQLLDRLTAVVAAV
jgi:hypothetical protein